MDRHGIDSTRLSGNEDCHSKKASPGQARWRPQYHELERPVYLLPLVPVDVELLAAGSRGGGADASNAALTNPT